MAKYSVVHRGDCFDKIKYDLIEKIKDAKEKFGIKKVTRKFGKYILGYCGLIFITSVVFSGLLDRN